MSLVKALEYAFHRSLADKGRTRRDFELPAILINRGDLPVIEQDALAMAAAQGLTLLLEGKGINFVSFLHTLWILSVQSEATARGIRVQDGVL